VKTTLAMMSGSGQTLLSEQAFRLYEQVGRLATSSRAVLAMAGRESELERLREGQGQEQRTREPARHGKAGTKTADKPIYAQIARSCPHRTDFYSGTSARRLQN